MKATISHSSFSNYWTIIYYRPSDQGLSAIVQRFKYPDGAFAFWTSIERQVIKEQKAFSKLNQINERLLSLDELNLIKKLQKSKCFNITKRQYGYLSGILERQRS